MKYIFIIVLLFSLNSSLAQSNTSYRFGFGVSVLSVMHYGITDMKNVSSPIYGHNAKVYQIEKYSLNYDNWNFSKGLNTNFFINVIDNKKYHLRLGGNVFIENYKEKLIYTLTDIGDGAIIDYGTYTTPYNENNIELGYSNSVRYGNKYNEKGFGCLFDITLQRKIKNNYTIGGGIFYYYHNRNDLFYRSEWNYIPLSLGFGSGSTRYQTKKVGLSIEFQKAFNRFNAFINLSQTVYTTKRANKKGGFDFYVKEAIVPISQNLDFRFPLIIKMGINIEFVKIKSKTGVSFVVPPF